MNVRGALFLDYVRMIKSHKGVTWDEHLRPDDLAFLVLRIDPDAWYPMATFERMGNAILHHVASDQMMPVRLWGRLSVRPLHAANPQLLAPSDPVETLSRFHVLRQTFFDFDALEVRMLHDEEAQIAIHYEMGMPAEEAASVQTMGFFEGLLELAGATEIAARFSAKAWAGAPRTLLDLSWMPPPR